MRGLVTHTVGFLFLLWLLGFVCTTSASAQVGGKKSFEFLNAPSSSILAGLGGVNVSLHDRDINLFYSNPALTGDTLAGIASANYQFYFGDIGHAAFTYAHPFEKTGAITFGIQHMNYGTIEGFDATGAETGDFNASETALLVSKSHRIGNYRLGATVKGAFSSIAGYRATGLALDLGVVFFHPEQDFTIGLTMRNLGVVISDYSGTGNSRLPFDVQVGSTFKPQHMPLRFSITAFNLTTPDATYDDPAEEDRNPLLQEVLAHFNFGAELLIHKNVNILAGYNYFNHRALKLETGGGGAGISFGFSAKVKNFEFVFSRMTYVAGTAAWSFTLSGNICKLIKRQ